MKLSEHRKVLTELAEGGYDLLEVEAFSAGAAALAVVEAERALRWHIDQADGSECGCSQEMDDHDDCEGVFHFCGSAQRLRAALDAALAHPALKE